MAYHLTPFLFPQFLCPACTADPDEATNIKWESGFPATVDTELTVDCREEHYSNETLDTSTTQVRCLEDGWWVIHPCVKGKETLNRALNLEKRSVLFVVLVRRFGMGFKFVSFLHILV